MILRLKRTTFNPATLKDIIVNSLCPLKRKQANSLSDYNLGIVINTNSFSSYREHRVRPDFNI